METATASMNRQSLEAILTASPTAVIAHNASGEIIFANDQARQILRYTGQHELIGRHITSVYRNPQDSYFVGRRLNYEADGWVRNVETILCSRTGEAIPVRLEATRLRDARGNHIETVGYFEDLRSIKNAEQRLTLLLRASSIVARAENLRDGLQSLAEMMVVALEVSLCRSFQLTEDDQVLVAEAAYPPISSNQLDWNPGPEERITVAEWPHFKEILTHGHPKVLRIDQAQDQEFLAERSRRLGLKQPVQSSLLIPLKTRDRIVGLLALAELRPWAEAPFSPQKLELGAAIAEQTAILIERIHLMNQARQHADQLAILHKIIGYIQAAKDVDKILHVMLTGITAGYGLRFNRAALFFWDESSRTLVGRAGIGHLNEIKARQAWKKDLNEHEGVYNLDRYFDRLERGDLSATPLGRQVEGLCLSIDPAGSGLFAQVINNQNHFLASEEDLDRLPSRFRQAFEPDLPFIIVPLIAREQCIGLLAADNKFSQTLITPADIDALLTFVITAAVTLDNTRLFQETEKARERLQTCFVASNALVSSQDPGQILLEIVNQAHTASDACGASLILIDQMGYIRDLVTTGVDENLMADQMVRPNGLSMRVMASGEPECIRNTEKRRNEVNPNVIERGIGASIALPVSLEGKRIGVMRIHYTTPRRFSKDEMSALQLYVNQAAIAYDSARRIKELEYLRAAAEALSGVAQLPDMLKQIVRSACEVLQADSAAILSYDAIRGAFMPEGTVTANIPEEVWQKFRKVTPRPGQTVYTVLERQWVGVTDATNLQEYDFLGENTKKLLAEIKARSFQGIALAAGDEKLGVLYVNYNKPRSFSAEERKTAQTFANHAALALKKVRLLEQVAKARNTAYVVAGLTVLEDLRKTLRSIVRGTQESLDCGATVLYTYDQERGIWGYPPITAGVRSPHKTKLFKQLPADSFVIDLLARRKPYIAEDVPNDPILGGRRFSTEEKVQSCIAYPLRVGDHKVGIIFINYRKPHHFTADELMNIELFANQAAVAIRNAQLYGRMQKQAGLRQAIYEAGQIITRSLDLDEILFAIAEQAQQLTHATRASQVALVNDNELDFVAAYPVEHLTQLHETVDKIDLTQSNPIGITGLAVVEQKSQLVNDVSRHPAYIRYNPHTQSELATPIMVGDDVIGVINVEDYEADAFDDEDRYALEALAAQAAIAIQNAGFLLEKEKRAQQMAAIADISRTINISLDLDLTLNTILTSINPLINYTAAEICLFDPLQGVMVVAGRAGDLRYSKQAGCFYSWDEGYTGWIARHRTSLLIEDSLTRQDVKPKVVDPERPIRSYLGIPLQAGDDWFGTLELVGDTPHFFNREAEEILGIIGQHAIIAIRNARLYKAEQRRVKHLEAVHQVSRVANSTLDSSEIFRRVLAEMLDVFELDRGYVALFDYEEGYGYTFIEHPEDEPRAHRNVIIPLTSNKAIEWVILEKRPLAISEAQIDTLADTIRAANEDWPVQSTLIVPTVVKQEVIGIIGLESIKETRKFTDQDIKLALILINQVTKAIENANLYDQLQQQVRVLATLNRAGHILTGSLDVDEILNSIVEQAWQLTIRQGQKISFACMRLVEEHLTRIVALHPPESGPKVLAPCVQVIDLREGKHDRMGIMGRVAKTGRPALVNNVALDPDYLECHPTTRSELAVPIKRGDQVIAVINLEHSEYSAFTPEDQQALEALAIQASIAIQNAQLYQQATDRLAESNTLQQVAVSLAGTSALTEVVRMVMIKAIQLINSQQGYLLLLGPNGQDFEQGFEIAINGSFKTYTHRVRQNGFTQGIIRTQESVVISDTQRAGTTDFLIENGCRAVVGVPLLNQGQAIGVLYVCSREPQEFSHRQVALLQALAGQATVAIDRARQFEELKLTKGLVGARTALAWMGMVSSIWRHSIEGHAVTIREEADLLRSDIEQKELLQVDRRLDKIKRLASYIFEKPITPPLSDEEGVESVYINNLLRERIRQLWENAPYHVVSKKLDFRLADAITVRASPEWLINMFDVLIDNAVEAMAGSANPLLTISTQAAGGKAIITFSDRGPGIEAEVLENLLKMPIKKSTGEKGMGMGLLMARTIAQTYGGEIRVGSTGPHGTSMVVELPVEAGGSE